MRNQDEERFAQWLEGKAPYSYEPTITYKATYKPDFVVVDTDDKGIIYEVKGVLYPQDAMKLLTVKSQIDTGLCFAEKHGVKVHVKQLIVVPILTRKQWRERKWEYATYPTHMPVSGIELVTWCIVNNIDYLPMDTSGRVGKEEYNDEYIL
jgi:hypothetical protein